MRTSPVLVPNLTLEFEVLKYNFTRGYNWLTLTLHVLYLGSCHRATWSTGSSVPVQVKINHYLSLTRTINYEKNPLSSFGSYHRIWVFKSRLQSPLIHTNLDSIHYFTLWTLVHISTNLLSYLLIWTNMVSCLVGGIIREQRHMFLFRCI